MENKSIEIKAQKFEHLSINILSHRVKYNWEYFGDIQRLVATPLTDRCFQTLFMAYHSYQGGAPEGNL